MEIGREETARIIAEPDEHSELINEGKMRLKIEDIQKEVAVAFRRNIISTTAVSEIIGIPINEVVVWCDDILGDDITSDHIIEKINEFEKKLINLNASQRELRFKGSVNGWLNSIDSRLDKIDAEIDLLKTQRKGWYFIK